MSQQGGRSTRHEDDWWGQLYGDSTEDTGPKTTADSRDDRFASAADAVDAGPVAEQEEGPPDAVSPAEAAVLSQRAPTAPGDDPSPQPDSWDLRRDTWEPPPAAPQGPAAFPPGPRPPGFTELPGRTPGAPPRPFMPPEAAVAVSATAGTAPSGREAPAPEPAGQGPRTATHLGFPAVPPPAATVDHVGSGPPTYDAEPTALPAADPDELDDLVADTVLDGARYGPCTLRAASVRGDSARYRGEPRRDFLLTARFGAGEQALILVAMATGARATPGAHRAAAEVCQWIGRAVGRSHHRLVEDIRAARRGDLKSGLHRLTDRSLGKLRASAGEQGVDPEEYSATLRCLLLPTHPECRTRVFFGVGAGGLFRLRGGQWQDIEPRVTAADTVGGAVVGFGSLPPGAGTGSTGAADAAPLFAEGDRFTMDLGIPTPPSPYEPAPEPPHEPFRFRASVARPGDALLMCSGGLADPLLGEPALCAYLARRWSGGAPPGLAAFLADTQVRVKGYSDDRTVAAVWEA